MCCFDDYILDVTFSVVVFHTHSCGFYDYDDDDDGFLGQKIYTKKSSRSARNKTKQNHYQPHTVCVCVCVEHTHKLTQMEINYNPKNKRKHTNVFVCLFVI